MATCTFAVGTADTGASPNTSGAFTPASGDLLVVFVAATATVVTGQLTSSIGGFTFSQVSRATWGPTSHSLYCFVSDATVSSATSQTVTAAFSGDESTGTVIMVYRVSGMTKTGLTAIRQSAKEDSKAGTDTPAPVFASSCLTGNPVLGAVGTNSNPAAVSPPTSWTEGVDTGYASPTAGGECIHRDSGFTGTTVTWNSTYGSAGCSLVVELDSSSSTTFAGTGAVTLPILTASGTGKKVRKGTGSPNLPVLTSAGTGKKTRKGSGAPNLPILTADGTGREPPHQGIGSPSLPILTASGSGKLTRKGSGAPTLPMLTASGTGKKVRKGSGAPNLPSLTASGAGKKTRKGAGAVTLPSLTASGAGKKTRKGTGSPNLPSITAAGVGRRTLRGSGSPTLPVITAAGVGTFSSSVVVINPKRMWRNLFEDSWA